MAAIYEKYAGRSGSAGEEYSADLQYIVTDEDSDADVFTLVLATAPSTHRGLPIRNVSIQPYSENENCWVATVRYGVPKLPTPSQAQSTVGYRFNFQAQGAHIYNSLATISSTGIGMATPPDWKQLINVVFDGTNHRCEGVQLNPPPETFSLDYTPVNAVVTSGYQMAVESVVGCVNNATYGGRPAGSLLLVRCSGGVRTNEDWQISFGFSYIPNQTNIAVSSDITVAAKDGHDLLWTYNNAAVDAGVIVSRPLAAYVERVWPRADFSVLGLGL